MRPWTVLAAALIVDACARAPAPKPARSDVDTSAEDRITLERRPCFGACPVYTVTLERSGKVRFEGHRFVADTGVSFAVVALLHAFTWRRAGSPWIVGGVALSVVAAAAQASGFDLHRHFNHNDLYHAVQALAMLAYYAGVRRLRDA